MILLASTLPNLTLQEGDPELLQQLLQSDEHDMPTVEAPGSGFGESPLFENTLRVVILLFLITLPFGLIFFIVSPDFRKWVLARTARLLLIIGGIFLVIKLKALLGIQRVAQQTPMTRVEETPVETDQSLEALPEFVPEPSQNMVVFSSLILAMVVLAALAVVLWLAWRRRQQASSPLQEVADVAQQTIDTFQAGGDFKNTVIRCYVQMSRILQEQHGIRRQETMTAREFEQSLVRAGLPQEPLQQLTRTFEAVRYGTKTPAPDEEHRTTTSLDAIMTACRELSS